MTGKGWKSVMLSFLPSRKGPKLRPGEMASSMRFSRWVFSLRGDSAMVVMCVLRVCR